MKSFSFVCILSLFLLSCSGSSTTKKNTDSTSTASDTITNVTNLGVGTAADDTAAKP